MQKKMLPIILLTLLIAGCSGSRTTPVHAQAIKIFGTDDPSNTDSPIIIADSSTGPIIFGGSGNPQTMTLAPGYYSIQNELFKINAPSQLVHSKSHGLGSGPYHPGMFEVKSTTSANSNCSIDLTRYVRWSLYLNSNDTKLGSEDKETVYLGNWDGSPTGLKFVLDQTTGPMLVRPGGPLTMVLLTADSGSGSFQPIFPPQAGYTPPTAGAWSITVHYCKGSGTCVQTPARCP